VNPFFEFSGVDVDWGERPARWVDARLKSSGFAEKSQYGGGCSNLFQHGVQGGTKRKFAN
jgi:hypothetical protein